jgi:hypothetical protein
MWTLDIRKRVGAVALVLLAACSSAEDRPRARSSPPAETKGPEAAPPSLSERRRLTPPKKVVVDNLATGRNRRMVKRSIRDLKRIGFWRKLTKELFVVEISARAGRRFVPKDAHLADAFRTLDIRGNRAGILCDITFYPTAMADDLARWTSYHERGLISDPPPTRRQLWAVVLAHELAHCFMKGNKEPDARRWEKRALGAFRDQGIG